MSPENEVPSEPTEEDKEWAVKLWDVLHKPGEENPRIKLARALSALRASWEKEKGELQAQIEKGFSCPRCEFYQKESEGLKRVFDAEKQALEERVRELTERIKNYER